ncbi:BMC domain-containing protein [Anaerobacillus alkaliphilus]|uniref:BMC domain-containing protein n=1 Tax=Anaerobacillus alkaliphilus TaxID=1548597 RepID=A0A4Q0VWS5_9BACI|nr:BMC domain-containing protein [Anaerobacillus alkaliphilus]RXJ04173.1 BMC domain-containing protein [Anaerobacillus alkaliphilus]
MERIESIGVIETQYYPVAVEILDQICKGTNVQLLTSENYLGGMLVSLIVGGSVSDVNEAVAIAKQVCQDKENNPLKKAIAISNPHPEILKYILPAPKEVELPAVVKSRRKKTNVNTSKEDL